ncbi:MAG TPA: hypothetical protein VGL13_00570 [Polyangiaceae bacterium]|jgi:hypothetical protein
MTTETRAIAGIGTAPNDESQSVRLMRPVGPGEGRPLDKSALLARLQAMFLAASSFFSKRLRRGAASERELELDDRDLVGPSSPPPLPSKKVVDGRLSQPDVKAFIHHRM